jgi:hypothetical protein
MMMVNIGQIVIKLGSEFYFFIAVWDDPPEKGDAELYPDYKLALERFIQASKVKAPTGIKQLIADVRNVATKEKYEKHEYKSQPEFITGGKLMKHQLDALK